MGSAEERISPYPPTPAPAGPSSSMARHANLVLGAWLFLSTFLWPHADASRVNGWAVGALAIVVSVIALRNSPMRFANTALGVWLLLSTFSISHLTSLTLWNNAIVAALMIGCSLVSNREGDDATGKGPRRARLSKSSA